MVTLMGLEVSLWVLALVALGVAIVAFMAWFAQPRMGAAPRRERVLAWVWISALVVAAVLALLALVVGRDVLHLF